MKLNELRDNPGARTSRKRLGRGIGSGLGKTSGRGHKGAKARKSNPKPRYFEGGQMPIYRRLPKRGFSNQNFERRFHVVNVSDLNRFDDGTTVDQPALIEAGLVPDDRLKVKILGDGEVSKRLTVVAGWYSKSAHEKITAAGGTAQNPKGEAFEFPKPKKKFVKRDKAKKPKGDDAPAAAAPDAPAAPAGEAAPE